MIIDARGLVCPQPVVMAEEALSKTEEGTVEILVDHKTTVKNLAKFAKNNGYYAESVKQGKSFRVKIVKGYSGEAPEEEPAPETAKPLLVVVATDTMGKEEDIGRILMKGFFETMKAYRQLPHTLFFLNAGVRLTTVDDEIVPVLKEIEAMGTEIYSCGTCLKHYDLESALRVGNRGATNHIVEGMQDFGKTVWIG